MKLSQEKQSLFLKKNNVKCIAFKNKKFTLLNKLLLFASIFFLLGFVAQEPIRNIPQRSFGLGERIEYRVHYGFINAAEAVVTIDNKLARVNDRPCYKITVFGKTTGAADMVTKVRDTWQSFVDTTAILPHLFNTNKREGNYKNNEKAIFDHEINNIRRIDLDKNGEQKAYKAPNNIQDVVSGYYYLRTIDFNSFKVGQSVAVKAFFEGEFYDMKMKYQGKSTIDTKYGIAKVIKINPILPKNNFFEDENSVRIWVSDDANKIPLKIEVDLKIGALVMDIKKYSGLRNPLVFSKK